MTTVRSWQLTYEDYLALPADGRRHELIGGEHFVTPAPTVRHQVVVGNLYALLRAYVRSVGRGRLLLAPVDVVLSETDVVQPDLLWLAPERVELLTTANLPAAPDLVIEVLSAATRRTDEVIKRKLYERHGVAEFWIVDPEVERVRVYRRAREGFAAAQELSAEADDHLESPLLPGFSCALAEVFEER